MDLIEVITVLVTRKEPFGDVAVGVERFQHACAVITELRAAAHASLAARDLADQLAADDRLRAALAACESEGACAS